MFQHFQNILLRFSLERKIIETYSAIDKYTFPIEKLYAKNIFSVS